MMKNISLIIIGFMMILGCSDQNSGGNVATENVIHAKLTLEGESDFSEALITISEHKNESDYLINTWAILSEAMANSNGEFEIESQNVIDSSWYYLQVNFKDYGFKKDSIEGSQIHEGLDIGTVSLKDKENIRIFYRREFDSLGTDIVFENGSDTHTGSFSEMLSIPQQIPGNHKLYRADKNEIVETYEYLEGSNVVSIIYKQDEFNDTCAPLAMQQGAGQLLSVSVCTQQYNEYVKCENEMIESEGALVLVTRPSDYSCVDKIVANVMAVAKSL